MLNKIGEKTAKSSKAVESQEGIKKAPSAEVERFNISNLGEFLTKAKEKVENVLKINPTVARLLLKGLKKALDKVGNKYKDLKEVHFKALGRLRQTVRDSFDKFDNLSELSYLTGNENIKLSKDSYVFDYGGESILLKVDELCRVNIMMVGVRVIDFKKARNFKDFSIIFNNSVNVLKNLENSKPKLPKNTPLYCEGLSKFSFWVDGEKYVAIPGFSFDFMLLKCEDALSIKEEKEMQDLEVKIKELKQKIIELNEKERTARRQCIDMDVAVKTPSHMSPKKFQKDLSELHKLQFRYWSLEDLNEQSNNLSDGGRKYGMEDLGEDGFILRNYDANGSPYMGQKFDRGICVESKGQNFIEKREYLPGDQVKMSKYLIVSANLYIAGKKEGEKILVRERIEMPNGKDLRLIRYDEETGNLKSVEDFSIDGGTLKKRKYDRETGRLETVEDNTKTPTEVISYSKDSQRPIVRQVMSTPERYFFIAKDGTEFSDYEYERAKNPKLTPDAYIARLSTVFDTRYAWDLYKDLFMEYVHDSPDPSRPHLRGTEKNHGDHWQTAVETVARVNNKGQALGDCDDFAFLAQAILKKQRINAHVIYIPNHAVCVWIHKRANGQYDAFSICTFGFDRNGDHEKNYVKDQAKIDNGYTTPQEALNSLFVKFKKSGLGVDNGIDYKIIKGKVEILSINKDGEKVYNTVNVEDLVI